MTSIYIPLFDRCFCVAGRGKNDPKKVPKWILVPSITALFYNWFSHFTCHFQILTVHKIHLFYITHAEMICITWRCAKMLPDDEQKQCRKDEKILTVNFRKDKMITSSVKSLASHIYTFEIFFLCHLWWPYWISSLNELDRSALVMHKNPSSEASNYHEVKKSIWDKKKLLNFPFSWNSFIKW